ncbi:MAG: 30S ribosomal protein S6 [Lentisphaerota bacterium]
MNKYEAMIIFSDAVKETALEDMLGHVKAEIKKLGGEVTSSTRLGKRAFARTMKKKEAGHYSLVAFSMAGSEIGHLQARLKLNEDIFRTQIVQAPPHPVKPVEVKVPAEGSNHDES